MIRATGADATTASWLVPRWTARRGLRWSDLDEDRIGLTVRRTLVEVTRKQITAEQMICPTCEKQQVGRLFCDPDGNPLRPGAVTVAFEAHARACGLPMIRLHDTRHGACSLLLAGGVPIEVVQMILGHASPAVTRQVYAHVMRQATADQVERATELLTKHRREQSVSDQGASDGSDGDDEAQAGGA